jgi:nucleoside-diphosphate-sugar epimerase
MVTTTVKVAITGGSGFIGRHVIAALGRQGVPYVVIGRTCPAETPHDCFRKVDLLRDDIPSAISDLGCTHLIHLAWYAEHGLYWESAENLEWVTASLSLIRAFSSQCKHVIAIGTCAEYDWSTGVCTEGRGLHKPATLYGRAKLATSQMVMDLCMTKNIPCCWARLFLPFGHWESHMRLIPSITAALLERAGPIAVGGENWRDFMAVEDVADAIVHLALTKFSGEINVCSGVPRQIRGLVNEICEYLCGKRSAVLEAVPTRGDQRWIIGDDTRLRASGWSPALSFSERLVNYLETIRNS